MLSAKRRKILGRARLWDAQLRGGTSRRFEQPVHAHDALRHPRCTDRPMIEPDRKGPRSRDGFE